MSAEADLFISAKFRVTAGANLAKNSLVDLDGTVPSDAAVCTGGKVMNDCASGDYVEIALPPSIVVVIATGTVTAGAYQEALSSTAKTKDGASTSYAGVQDRTSTDKVVGRAITGGSAGALVLVQLTSYQE